LQDVFEKFEAAAPAPDTVLDDAGLADPLFGVPSTVKTLKVLKVFKSAARPFLCEIDFEDSLLSPRRFIFKKGDDMRCLVLSFLDILILLIFPKGRYVHHVHVLPLQSPLGTCQHDANTLRSPLSRAALQEG